MTIGQRISELRKTYGYSQEYIAEKLNVSRQAVSKWEQDLSAPDTYNLIALAELLDVSVEYLATGKRPIPPQPEAVPTEPSPVPPPSPQRNLNTPKIAGLILLGAGLLSLILGCLFSRTLLLLSAFLLLYGILCLTVRKHLGLVLLWITIVIAFFITIMLMPVKTVESSDGGVTVRRTIPLVFWLLFVIAVLITVITIVKQTRKKK